MNLLSQRLPRFLITSVVLYVAWYLFYSHLIHAGSSTSFLDVALCRHIAEASAAVLRVGGYAAEARYGLLYIDGYHLVTVGWQCDGLPVVALFAGFVIAYPGPWRAKLWFVPAGMLLIHFINILRVAALALNQLYSRGTTDFNHHYTYTIIVYGFIFWLWTVWVRRFATPADPAESSVGGDAAPSASADA